MACYVCTHLSIGVCPCMTSNTHVSDSCPNICKRLTLGMCRCTTTETHSFDSSLKKRKACDEVPFEARKRACNPAERKRGWGYSATLMMHDDPWKIKKVLERSDLGNMSRLMLAKDLVENLALPVLGANEQRDAETEKGIEVTIWDVDTNSMHSLLFKRWVSSRSYVFVGKWVQDFVKRRGLKKGDEIGFHWDFYKNRFDFSVLDQA